MPGSASLRDDRHTAAEEMSMTESIVCGIDDSAEASDTARIANSLAQRLGARLILVNVSAPIAYVPLPGRFPQLSPDEQEAYREERRRRAEKALAATAHTAGVEGSAELRVSEGDVTRSLIDEARREGAMLIVVGSRGQGAILSAILGSVSTALVREARCPVVVVPPGPGGSVAA
jgi:nucleotide-binding universal stress UspA family protein